MEEALKSSQRSSQFLSRLTQRKQLLKKSARNQRHKFDWQREKVSLNSEARALEQEISRHFDNLAALEQKPRASKSSSSSRDADDLRRENILAEAKRMLGQQPSPQPIKNKLLEELVVEEGALRTSREELCQEMFAQVFAMRSLLQNNVPHQEMAELLRAVRGSINHSAHELHEELMTATRDASETKNQVFRTIRSVENKKPDKVTFVDGTKLAQSFASFARGYEDSVNVIKTVEDAQVRILELMEKFDSLLSEVNTTKIALGKQREKFIAADTWFGDAEHEQFLKLYRELVLRGRGLGAFMERVEFEFPTKTRAEIESHLNWVEARRRITQGKKDLLASREREFAQLRETLLAEITKQIELADMERVKRGETKKHEQNRRDVHARLEEQREIANVRLQILERINQEKEARLKEEQEKQAELEEMQRARKHAIVAEFNRQKEFEKRMAMLQEEQHKEVLEEMKRERAPINMERVGYREQQRLERLEMERERAQLEHLETVAKEQELAKLKTTVPYFNKLKEILPSRARLESSTFSSAVVPDGAYKDYNKEGLFKRTGFTSDQVCKDVRFKVVEALRSKGLTHSTYARTLLRNMSQAQTINKNLHTTF